MNNKKDVTLESRKGEIVNEILSLSGRNLAYRAFRLCDNAEYVVEMKKLQKELQYLVDLQGYPEEGTICSLFVKNPKKIKE